jgi:ArsR family transcriptional regulator
MYHRRVSALPDTPPQTEPRAPAGSTGAAITDFVPFFKAFCNGTRAGIVEQLLAGERCVCELTADLEASQPLISHHLAVLRDAGFVQLREEGTRTYYAIDWDRFEGSLDAFRAFVSERRAHPVPGGGC